MNRIHPAKAGEESIALTDDKIWLDRIEVLLTNTTDVKDKAYKESALHTAKLIKNKWLMGIATLVGDMAMSAVLGSFGILMCSIYANFDFELTPSTADSDGSIDQFFFLFVVVGPIYTIWNIAQYASFAIQTTGHVWPRNHLWALLDVGPLLLITNAVAWTLLLLAYYYIPMNTIPVVLVHVPILATAILSGIWCKTYAKVGYIFGKYNKAKFAVRDDAFVDKYYALFNDFNIEDGVTCPFTTVSKKTVAKQAFGPVLCFLWTTIYTIGLGLLYKLSDHIAYQWFLFFLTIAIFMFGNWLLQKFISKSKGIMMYSKKMILVFFYIYGMVACSQVRLVITKFTGTHRLIASLVFAGLSFSLRQYSSRKFKHQYESFQRKGQDVLNMKSAAPAPKKKYTPSGTESGDGGDSVTVHVVSNKESAAKDGYEMPKGTTPTASPVKPSRAAMQRRNSLSGKKDEFANSDYQSISQVPEKLTFDKGRKLFSDDADAQASSESPEGSNIASSTSSNGSNDSNEPSKAINDTNDNDNNNNNNNNKASGSPSSSGVPNSDGVIIEQRKKNSPRRQKSLQRQGSLKRKNSLSRKQTLKRLSTTGEQLRPFIALSRRADQLCISAVASLITQNVCTILLAGLSCTLYNSNNTVLTLGECPNGLVTQLMTDLGPLLVFDFLEIFIFVTYFKVPTIHFFLQFDWFMIVAALLVVYLDVVVVLWAISPLFGNSF